jgi:hypothetical protein
MRFSENIFFTVLGVAVGFGVEALGVLGAPCISDLRTDTYPRVCPAECRSGLHFRYDAYQLRHGRREPGRSDPDSK